MTYNIHPIFVHFPIVLLLIYSFIKIIPFDKWFPNVSWKHIERVFLLLGVLGAYMASYTGEIAEDLVQTNESLLKAHSTFASISIWFYSLLLLGELISVFNPIILSKFSLPKTNTLLLFIQKILTQPILSKILAFLGLISISVTGLLGGVMVFGTSADPLASIILKILGIDF